MSRKLENIKDWKKLAQEAAFEPRKMAALCNVSVRQLEQHFKKHLQMPPSRCIRNVRFDLAKKLMAGGFSTKAVAKDLKFASESHFCHAFMQTTGVSPREFAPAYRRKNP